MIQTRSITIEVMVGGNKHLIPKMQEYTTPFNQVIDEYFLIDGKRFQTQEQVSDYIMRFKLNANKKLEEKKS